MDHQNDEPELRSYSVAAFCQKAEELVQAEEKDRFVKSVLNEIDATAPLTTSALPGSCLVGSSMVTKPS